jgi:hypothetical protein
MTRLARRVAQEIVFGAWRGTHRVPPRRATARLFTGHDLRVILPEPIACDIWLDGGTERDLTTLVRGALRSGMTFVDLAAHYGYYTVLAADAVGPYGRVYAFETDPTLHAVLRSNAARLEQVRCERELPPFPAGLDRYLERERRRVHVLKVPALPPVLELLRGAERVLSEDRPLIAIARCSTGKPVAANVVRFLERYGYRIAELRHGLSCSADDVAGELPRRRAA